MGRLKKSRKIRSGNKMVRIALHKQKVLYSIQMTTIIAMCRSTIGIIQAQKLKKGGATPDEVLSVVKNECVIPIIELNKEIASINKNNIKINIPQNIGSDDLLEKLRRFKEIEKHTSSVPANRSVQYIEDENQITPHCSVCVFSGKCGSKYGSIGCLHKWKPA